MKIAIHQPQYLPWLGYFDKMDQVDTFVLLDDVQYKKNEWQNRNKIRTSDEWQWLTVPVMFKFGEKINQVRTDNHQDWRARQRKSLELNYSNAPHFWDYFTFFRDVFAQRWEFLVDINLYFIEYLKDALGIRTDLVRSSVLKANGSKTERLVEICKALKADAYLSGAGGDEYLDKGQFEENGIALEFQRYSHPRYRQAFEGFYPYMSVVDLLFCHGKDSSNIIKEGRNK